MRFLRTILLRDFSRPPANCINPRTKRGGAPLLMGISCSEDNCRSEGARSVARISPPIRNMLDVATLIRGSRSRWTLDRSDVWVYGAMTRDSLASSLDARCAVVAARAISASHATRGTRAVDARARRSRGCPPHHLREASASRCRVGSMASAM